jgi:hypothetical protein
MIFLFILLLTAVSHVSSTEVCVNVSGPRSSVIPCIDSETGNIVSISAAFKGVTQSWIVFQSTTSITDSCITPPSGIIVTDLGKSISVNGSCVANIYNGTNPVTINYFILYSPDIVSIDSVLYPLVNISSSFWLSSAQNAPVKSVGSYLDNSIPLNAPIKSLDVFFAISATNTSMYESYIPYGNTVSLSQTGGFLHPLPNNNNYTFVYGDGHNNVTCVPLVTMNEIISSESTKNSTLGISLALSPNGKNPVLGVRSLVYPQTAVEMRFSIEMMRLRSDEVFTVDSHILFHAPNWRSSLWVYSNLYSDLFQLKPYESNINSLWGAGQYADYRGQTDPVMVNTTLLAELGLSVNWDATFPFPFWGLWLGLGMSSSTTEWQNCVAVGHVDVYSNVYHPQRHGTPVPGIPDFPGTGLCELTSYDEINSWYQAGKQKLNMQSLYYANLFEWGYAIDMSATDFSQLGCDASNTTAYCTANKYWFSGFNNTYIGDGDYANSTFWNGSEWIPVNGTWPIAPGVKILDPNAEPYRTYILDMLLTQIISTPDGSGMCVDRSDHSKSFNHKSDDGFSWKDNQPVAWLGYSYQSVIADMSTMLHLYNKSAWVSPTNPRIDLMGIYDGFYDEFGDTLIKMPVDGIIAMNKPAIAWYWSNHSGVSLDQYLPLTILHGLTPSVPWDLGDHILSVNGTVPNPIPLFQSYAHIYNRIIQKQWILEPFAVEAFNLTPVGSDLWKNIYMVQDSSSKLTGKSVLAPIYAYDLSISTFSVSINVPPTLKTVQPSSCMLLYPGEEVPCPAPGPIIQSDDSIILGNVSTGLSSFVTILLGY